MLVILTFHLLDPVIVVEVEAVDEVVEEAVVDEDVVAVPEGVTKNLLGFPKKLGRK